MPKMLTAEQKQLRVDVSEDILDCVRNDPNFLKNVITGDETWVYGHDPETKVQSSQWKHSSSPEAENKHDKCIAKSKSNKQCYSIHL